MSSIKRYFIPFLLLISTAWFAFTPADRYFEVLKNLDIFATLFKEVNALYVDEVDPEKLVNTGIEAMLQSLDPYTTYIPEEEADNFTSMTTGKYAGIGASIGTFDGKVVITMPFENFAAHKAGIQVGDEIVTVDGINVKDKQLSEVSNLLKGNPETTVELEIIRYGNDKPVTYKFNRERIEILNVPYYGIIEEGIGFIKLQDFTHGAGKEVKEAVNLLKNQGAEKIILDIRDNPGGLLNEAVNVANVFIPTNKVVVETRSRLDEWNKIYKTTGTPADIDIPLVVLVNKVSASASEIVAGAIQDYDRGILIGRNTFGKGLVQTTRSLGYNSRLKVTTAKYYTPSGRCIQALDYDENGVGIVTPDSMKVAYKTTNGRTVYDGNGLKPDVLVEVKKTPSVITALHKEGLFFDYATKWVGDYSNKDFAKSEGEFTAFSQWLSDKEYEYESTMEKMLSHLKASAKKEAYLDDIEEDIFALEKAIEEDKQKDIHKYKAEILEILEAEIATRQSLYKGKITSTFDNDPDILKAMELLKENSFSHILSRN